MLHSKSYAKIYAMPSWSPSSSSPLAINLLCKHTIFLSSLPSSSLASAHFIHYFFLLHITFFAFCQCVCVLCMHLGLEYCWLSLSLLVRWCCCFASFFFCCQFALLFVQLPAYAVCTVCQSRRCTRVTLHVKLIRFCNCKGEIVKIDN